MRADAHDLTRVRNPAGERLLGHRAMVTCELHPVCVADATSACTAPELAAVGRWAELFEPHDAVWLVGLSPDEAIRAIAGMHDSFCYRRTIEGSHLAISPRAGGRGGGRPIYRVVVDAEAIPGASRVESHVIPSSIGLRKAARLSAVLAAILAVLHIMGVRFELFMNVSLELFMFLFAGAAVLFFVQLLFMGFNRRFSSRRFARRMAAINATRVEQPVTTTR
jgi:hypothetical protein